jgi:hypothetical protein
VPSRPNSSRAYQAVSAVHKRAEDLKGEPAYPNSIQINDALKVFNGYFPERAKDKTAKEHHDFLSEFCHPNGDAFTNHLDRAGNLNHSRHCVEAA